MKKIFIIFGILAAFLALSCEKAQPEEEPTDIVTSHNCALVIVKPDGSEYTYDIHCVIRNGGTVTNSPTLTAFYDYTLFFRDDITEQPMVTVMDHKVEAFLPGGVPRLLRYTADINSLRPRLNIFFIKRGMIKHYCKGFTSRDWMSLWV